MAEVSLGRQYANGRPITPITPTAFTAAVKGKSIATCDYGIGKTGTIRWCTLELSDGSYISVDLNGANGTSVTFTATPR